MSLFDFNRDGKNDFWEDMLGIGLLSALRDVFDRGKAAEARARAAGDIEAIDASIREQLQQLLSLKENLEAAEPEDCSSPAWEAWDERCDALQDEIDDLEAALYI